MMKTTLFLILITGLFFGVQTETQAQSSEKDASLSVIGVKMDAEWCPKCHEMNPKLENIMPEFNGEEVLFVKFNMTDDFTRHQSSLLAKRLGLTDLFNKNEGQTGYMVLVDANTNEELKTLTSDQTEDELITEIENILSQTRQ